MADGTFCFFDGLKGVIQRSSRVHHGFRSSNLLQPDRAERSLLKRTPEISAAALSLSMPLNSAAGARSPDSGPVSTDVPFSRTASNDPSTSGPDVTAIHSPEELAQFLSANPGRLVVLMCKAIGCRPCKMFARKYQRVASTYKDCIFLEVTGDETTNLRKLMIQMGVRATPTFRLYREGECVKTSVGIDETKLRSAVKECLKKDEAGYELLEES